MRTILTNNGTRCPDTQNLNVVPLRNSKGDVIFDGLSKPILNDRFYIDDTGQAHNIYRHYYCEKMYLSVVNIQDSIGIDKLMSSDLKLFVNHISDKLVFNKYGKWYRIFLRKTTNRTFGILKVVPYNWTIKPNMTFNGFYCHSLCLDWRSAFYI